MGYSFAPAWTWGGLYLLGRRRAWDEDRRAVFNERFLDFAQQFGFRPKACRPYSPRTKGKVERPIRYIRSSFFQGLTVNSLADLNQQAGQWRDTVANVRTHQTTLAVPAERLAAENLQPLDGRMTFDTSLYSSRRVARDCYIAYGGNRYSVPWRLVGRDVLIRVTAEQELQVLWQGQIVARHGICRGRGQFIRAAEHFRGLPKGRPGRPVMHLVARPSAGEVEIRPLSVYDETAGVTAGA